jgi:hypothetical protein
MSPEREKEYEELSGYLDFFATHVMGVAPASPMHTTAALKRIAEDYGRSKALEGLRQAANDTVQSLHNKAGVAKALDAALRANGLVGFYEIARRYGNAFRKILKRGRINNETEHYLVHGAFADCASSLADDDERAELARLVERFENATVGKRL